MIDGIIHALASYERVERKKETQDLNQHFSFNELEMTLTPELMQILSMRLSDGREVVEHILEAKALYKDLNNIGRT